MNLLSKPTQLRVRRSIRRRQRQVEAAAVAAEKQFDTNLIGRFDRLLRVRRFTLGWLTLAALITFCTILQTLTLGSYYQTLKPTDGGIYNEGIVGTYSNANPLYATGSVDVAISRLLFAGLLTYNNKNQLSGNLASSWSVDATGKHYVVILRSNLTWHDGKPLTSTDVAFTYKLIQNPDAESPLQASWQNIVISTPNARTVTFDLPNAFSAFPYNLTVGILPQHILQKVPAQQLRADSFNTVKPVGAGPFQWQAIQTNTSADPDKTVSLIALQPFKQYVGGTPNLSGYVLHAYGSKSEMINGFQKRDINAMAGLDTIPNEIKNKSDVTATSFASTAAVMSFFKTSSGVLAEPTVRQALVQGADTETIIKDLGYSTRPVRSPFLIGQSGYYDRKYDQASYNVAAAQDTLTKAGWAVGAKGIRYKDGKPLTFHLYAQDTAENKRTVATLVKNWRVLGVDVTPVLQPLTDFQTTIEFHTYEALLYGISIGVDPDVYAYWDSSQADIRSTSRLNFSEYTSSTADAALESGRTRLSAALRTIKYRPFLQAWQTDAPALGLYQPRFLYITRDTVYGLDKHTLNTDADRYNNIHEWQIRTVRVTN